MTLIRRYGFKLYPNTAQQAALERQAMLTARLWNAALEQREWQWRYEVEKKGRWRGVARPKEEKPCGLTYYDQARELKYLRAADPEYAAMSCASLELCLGALDLAFKAFWRRLKEGVPAGEAGFPRYKSSRRHRTIWHRDGSGWKMTPAGKHSKFYFKGIPGTMKARGRFPLHPDELRTMEIIERDGAWFASVVVRQTARIAPGRLRLIVHFDLLDEFARVENAANGECLPGLTPVFAPDEGRIAFVEQGGLTSAVDAAPQTRGDGRRPHKKASSVGVDAAPQTRGDGRFHGENPARWRVDAAQQTRGDGRGDDAIQSLRDRRFKKFSYRWRRETKRIAKQKAHAARVRREALHLWTTIIIQHASEIVVIAPPIRENTQSAKGDAREWGGAVKTVAELNRNTLAQAPALAIQMLEYKSAEAGIEFRQIAAEDTKLAIGRDLPEAVKKARRVRRKLKETA